MGGLLLLLMLLSGVRCSQGSPSEDEDPLPPLDQWGRKDKPPGAGRKVSTNDPAPPAWPQALPPSLPPFPAGWTYAEPVPTAVRARAWQLLKGLLARGQGSTAAEMTGGEWIVYRAEVVDPFP